MNTFPTFLTGLLFLLGSSVSARAEDVKLVIIGAGASGYAAGCRLLENNFTDFVILEAQDRIGGRVHSIPFGNGHIDMGGQWIHGITGNPVYKLAREQNLVYSVKDFLDGGQVFRSDGKRFDPNLFDKIMEIYFNVSGDTEAMKGYNRSLGDFFTEKYWPKITPLVEAGNITHEDAEGFLKLMENMENANDASPSWFDTSVNERDPVGEDNINVWKMGGYSTVFKLLSKKLPNPAKQLPIDEKIRLGKVVTKVNWQGNRVVVGCADGTEVTADQVLVTVSLNVLKATAEKIFNPPLPESNMKGIRTRGMGTLDKIYMEFPYRWWDTGLDGLMIFWRPEDAANLTVDQKWIAGVHAFTPVDGHPLNLLCGWINGKDAEAMESLSDEVVKRETEHLLRTLVGPATQVPDAVAMYRSRWFSNPFTRGSYSYRTFASDAADVWTKDIAQPVVNSTTGKLVILFAGEATNNENFATVHGAIETGWREADRILNHD